MHVPPCRNRDHLIGAPRLIAQEIDLDGELDGPIGVVTQMQDLIYRPPDLTASTN